MSTGSELKSHNRSGPTMRLSGASRGAAVGDRDNDGRPDLVVTNNNGPVHILRNRLDTGS